VENKQRSRKLLSENQNDAPFTSDENIDEEVCEGQAVAWVVENKIIRRGS